MVPGAKVASFEGVNQVIGGFTMSERKAKCIFVGNVNLMACYATNGSWVTRECHGLMAGTNQRGYQGSPDEPRGPCHRYAHAISMADRGSDP